MNYDDRDALTDSCKAAIADMKQVPPLTFYKARSPLHPPFSRAAPPTPPTQPPSTGSRFGLLGGLVIFSPIDTRLELL